MRLAWRLVALCVLTILVKGVGYSLGYDVPVMYCALIAAGLAILYGVYLLLKG